MTRRFKALVVLVVVVLAVAAVAYVASAASTSTNLASGDSLTVNCDVHRPAATVPEPKLMTASRIGVPRGWMPSHAGTSSGLERTRHRATVNVRARRPNGQCAVPQLTVRLLGIETAVLHVDQRASGANGRAARRSTGRHRPFTFREHDSG